jgi:hypothetical protein
LACSLENLICLPRDIVFRIVFDIFNDVEYIPHKLCEIYLVFKDHMSMQSLIKAEEEAEAGLEHTETANK